MKSKFCIKSELAKTCFCQKFTFKNEQICINLTKVMIYLLTSCNTEEQIALNIYIHNSNGDYIKESTTTTILSKKRIGIGCKNYEKQCPGLEFRLISKLGWAGLKPKS